MFEESATRQRANVVATEENFGFILSFWFVFCCVGVFQIGLESTSGVYDRKQVKSEFKE